MSMPGRCGAVALREDVDDVINPMAGRLVGVREPDGRGTTGVSILMATMVQPHEPAGQAAPCRQPRNVSRFTQTLREKTAQHQWLPEFWTNRKEERERGEEPPHPSRFLKRTHL